MRRIAISMFIFVVIISSLFAFGSRETKEDGGRDWFIYDSYENAAEYVATGEFSNGDEGIKSVVVRWRSGDITVEEGGDTLVSVRESVSGLSDDEKMHILVRDGVLYVEFCAGGYKFTREDKRKPLKLEIPSGISLTIVSSSGDITLNSFTGRSLNLESISGSIHTGGITLTGELALKSVSGSFSIGSMIAAKAELCTVSGKVEIGKMECGEAILNVTSGDVRIDDFTVSGDAVFKSSSGDISLSGNAGSLSIDTSVGNVESSSLSVDGRAEIKIVSGDITISSLSSSSAGLSSTSGNITISSLSAGYADFSSSSGAIRVDSFDTESFNIKSSNGDVILSLSSPSDGEVKTSTGDVYFSSLPENTVLKYKMNNGDISYTDLLSYCEGVFIIGNGDHLISVSTSTGKLTVK